MARFDDIFQKMLSLEFSNESDALHKNKTEKGFTFFGIYRIAHPNWAGWETVDKVVSTSKNLKDASKILYRSEDLRDMVKAFYNANFWKKMKLSLIEEQHVANEIFVFGVNAGTKAAIKLAQRVVKVEDDGIIGDVTITALNSVNADWFDKEFDKAEIAYYEAIVRRNPEKKIFMNGWRARANAI